MFPLLLRVKLLGAIVTMMVLIYFQPTQCKLPVFISIYKRTGYGFDRSIKAVLTIFESFKIHILYIDFAKDIQTTNIK